MIMNSKDNPAGRQTCQIIGCVNSVGNYGHVCSIAHGHLYHTQPNKRKGFVPTAKEKQKGKLYAKEDFVTLTMIKIDINTLTRISDDKKQRFFKSVIVPKLSEINRQDAQDLARYVSRN